VWCSIFEIQFGAAQHDDRRHPHPHRQSGGGAQRTLGCVVISEIRQIPSKGGLVSKVSREREERSSLLEGWGEGLSSPQVPMMRWAQCLASPGIRVSREFLPLPVKDGER